MNKLAKYLNQHLTGEVLVDNATLGHFSTNNGALLVKPEMVVYPRNTSDIRKLLRFAWQLAEKGHTLPVAARGSGQNTTDAALSSGVVIAMDAHLKTIFEYDAKQLLVRLQPGVTASALQNSLRLQGVAIHGLGASNETVGGILANSNTVQLVDAVEQLEVVLANGDILQTKKLSKREVNKIKGQHGFEADIYREIDGLLDDYADTINGLDEADASGYSAIRSVRAKDGSIDLAPLFIGSQGTLGVISEMILRAEYTNTEKTLVVASFSEQIDARDALDGLRDQGFAKVEYYDGALLRRAEQTGKSYEFAKDSAAVIAVTLDDVSIRSQARKVKKLEKQLGKLNASIVSGPMDSSESGAAILGARIMADHASDHGTAVAAIDDVYIPLERFEDFSAALQQLATQLSVDVPLYGQPNEGLWSVRPMLSLGSVTGKQLLIKFIDKYAKIVKAHGGYLAGGHGEGLLQASFVSHDEKTDELYQKIRAIFDPQSILNPQAKQSTELRELVKKLRGASVYRAPAS